MRKHRKQKHNPMDKIKISFIGCGNMGRGLIGGLIANGHSADCICGSDVDAAQRQLVRAQYGIEVLDDNVRAIQGADVVVLAVKPQIIRQTLEPLRGGLAQGHPLLLSIAAGIRLEHLARWGGAHLAIVRVMPNTPALIRAGAAALCANARASAAQRNTAEAIMRSVGIITWVEDDVLIDAVTALSGSGPAYYFYMMEVMEQAGIKLGLAQEQARILTLQTALGAAKMALESKDDPATLRRQVTSPGGTTERALNVLRDGGFEELLTDALKVAYERAGELARTSGDTS